MAYTTIPKSTNYFNTKLYTGNFSTNAITGVGFQPDFTWIKSRDTGGEDNYLFDAIRGVTNYIHSNTTAGIGQVYANFGNGYFGTTAVSSAGTNASGNGIFEYDVPAGYTALSTKGLNL